MKTSLGKMYACVGFRWEVLAGYFPLRVFRKSLNHSVIYTLLRHPAIIDLTLAAQSGLVINFPLQRPPHPFRIFPAPVALGN